MSSGVKQDNTRQKAYEARLRKLGFAHLIEPFAERFSSLRSDDNPTDLTIVDDYYTMLELENAVAYMVPQLVEGDDASRTRISSQRYAIDSILSLAILSRERPAHLAPNYRRVVIATPNAVQQIRTVYGNHILFKTRRMFPGLIRAAESVKKTNNADATMVTSNNKKLSEWARLKEIDTLQKAYYWVRNTLSYQFLQDPQLPRGVDNPPLNAALMGAKRDQCGVLFVPLNFDISMDGGGGSKQHWVTLAYVCDEERSRVHDDKTIHGFILDSLMDYITREDIYKAAFSLENTFRLFGVIDPSTPPIQYMFLDVQEQPDGFSCGYQFFERSNSIMKSLTNAKDIGKELTLHRFIDAVRRQHHTAIPSDTCTAIGTRMTQLADSVLQLFDIGPRKGLKPLA